MNIEEKCINAIRYLGLKSIQAAGGGHVGMTISASPITFTLFTKFISINSNNGKWINRDRFILSGGHGSMSVYPIFHLAGLMNLDELKNFKKENSKTPGHPEYENKIDNFIDASTGPLGQGFAMGVGMAIAEKHLSNKTKKKFPKIFNHYTYVVVGDGDLQEGITYEAAAIAGKHQLNKLIVLHDSNKYQLDSSVAKVSNEDLKKRFESVNWFYQKTSNKPHDIERAIKNAHDSNLPSFIEVDTIIAESLDIQNSNKGHHGIITDIELEKFNNHFKTDFKDWKIDEEIYTYFRTNVNNRGLFEFNNWIKECKNYQMQNLEEFNKIQKWIENNEDYEKYFNIDKIKKSNQATRVYLKDFIENIDKEIPNIISLSADVASSCNLLIGDKSFEEEGNSFYVGIREFAMGAISNGINLHGGLKVISGTFLVFADYLKSAIRLGAMMKIPNIFFFTHDSYQVGGDGPTHQPYDQIPMLRAIENVFVHRPCDEVEFRQAIIEAFNSKDKTHIIILTRQPIPSYKLDRNIDGLKKNGLYVLKDVENPDFVIAANGSEVQIALKIAEEIPNTKVISVPCLEKINNLNEIEKENLFNAKKALLTMEATADYKWLLLNRKGQKNLHIGAFEFGKSMDGEILYKKKGFNVEKIIHYLKNNI
ncbi:MAG: transketolase [Metamycoplasmataceae bacterium]